MIKVNNRTERKQAVNAINVYDERVGIPTSQRAKYELPFHQLIGQLIPGKDAEGKSVDDLGRELHKGHYFVKRPSIVSTINNMMDPEGSVHPHRRNFGVTCFRMIEKLGGLHYREVAHSVGRPTKEYYFGTTSAKVTAFFHKHNKLS